MSGVAFAGWRSKSSNMPESPLITNTLFWVFASISVVSALGLVLHRSIIYSALMLIAVFLSIAAFFVLNNADFLAIAQTIVYAVGLTIILIFGVMFTGEKPAMGPAVPASRLLLYAIITALTGGLLLKAVNFPFTPLPGSVMPVETLQMEGTAGMLGKLLFQEYVLPFELASILLLVAMIGAIVISKKQFTSLEETMGRTKLPINTDSFIASEAEVLLEKRSQLTAPAAESKTPVGVAATESSSQGEAHE